MHASQGPDKDTGALVEKLLSFSKVRTEPNPAAAKAYEVTSRAYAALESPFTYLYIYLFVYGDAPLNRPPQRTKTSRRYPLESWALILTPLGPIWFSTVPFGTHGWSVGWVCGGFLIRIRPVRLKKKTWSKAKVFTTVFGLAEKHTIQRCRAPKLLSLV